MSVPEFDVDTKKRVRLSRDAIVDAARRLVDEHGADALSMRAVADALGASPMALYRYVADRRDLEIAVARAVSNEFVLDEDPDVAPEEAIATWMRRIRAHWLHHPWFGHLLGQHPELQDFMVSAGGYLVRALKRAGASDQLTGQEVIRIFRTALGVVLMEQGSPLRKNSSSTRPRGTEDESAILRAARSYDDDQLFEHVIQSTLLGLRARLEDAPAYEGDSYVHP